MLAQEQRSERVQARAPELERRAAPALVRVPEPEEELVQWAGPEQVRELVQRMEPLEARELGREQRAQAAQGHSGLGPSAARVKAGRASQRRESSRHRRAPWPARERWSGLAPGRMP